MLLTPPPARGIHTRASIATCTYNPTQRSDPNQLRTLAVYRIVGRAAAAHCPLWRAAAAVGTKGERVWVKNRMGQAPSCRVGLHREQRTDPDPVRITAKLCIGNGAGRKPLLLCRSCSVFFFFYPRDLFVPPPALGYNIPPCTCVCVALLLPIYKVATLALMTA